MKNKSTNNNPTISASGGKGGDSYGNGKAGDGGEGGKVIMAQVGKEFTKEGITISDLKNPHKEYWGMLFKKIKNIFKNNLLNLFFD